MGLFYRKKIKVSDQTGINVSKSGFSVSSKTPIGTFGTKGFSFKTGIPGLYYRKHYGKRGGLGFIIILFSGLIYFIVVVLQFLIKIFNSIIGKSKLHDAEK